MKKKINNGIFYVVISLISVLAVGSVMAVAYSGYGTPKVVVEGNYIEAGQPAEQPVAIDESLGASAGPQITDNIFSIGGLAIYSSQIFALPTASTTICAFRQPSATSTATFAAISLIKATSSAMTVTISVNNTTPFATTTGNRLGASLAIPANSLDNVIASTSAGNILIPNLYTVVGVAGFSTGFDVDGYCSLEAKQLVK